MYKKLVAVLLICLLLFQVPIVTVAANDNLDIITRTTELNELSKRIVKEITDKREEKAKYFELDDNQIMKVDYSIAIHKLDENGNWQDAFNKKCKNCVEFSTEGITISRDGYGISIAHECSLHGKLLDVNSEHKIYKNVYENTDLEYKIFRNKLKENLILNSKNVPKEFVVNYSLKGLTANQVDKKNVELLNENQKCIYTVSTPKMVDSSGQCCEGLSLQVLENKSNKLKIKIICDKDWIENKERVFPVFVDPDYKDEFFDFIADKNIDIVSTNWRKKDTSTSVFLNLVGSDFKDFGVITVSVFGRNRNGECNCTYQTNCYFLEAGKKYELYNLVRENDCDEVQIRFKALKGQRICGKWSPDYSPDSGVLRIGDTDGPGNVKDTEFSLIVSPSRSCWTMIRTKANASSIYLQLFDPSGRGDSVNCSIWGMGGKQQEENCTYQQSSYTLQFGKKYELLNLIKENKHSGVQLRFEGTPGTKVNGKWSPDYVPEPGCITVGNGTSVNDAVAIRPILYPQKFASVELDVEPISQHPEFPTGCESVSAVMVLHFYDHGIAVRDFIDKFLIKKSLTEGPDPNSAFVGNPYKNSGANQGYGCFAPCIAKAMNKVLRDCRAEVIRGQSLPSIAERYVKAGNPILIWATMGMKKTSPGTTWTIGYVDENAQLRKGDKFTWPRNEHCVVLIGFNEKDYFVNDPYQVVGKVKGAYEKVLLEQRFTEMGSQAVVVHRTVVPVPKQPTLKPVNLNEEIVKKVQDFAKGLGVQTVKNAAEPIFMVVGAFSNSSEIQSMPSRFEAIKIGDQQVYIMGKITGNILSTLVGITQTAIGISEIAGGVSVNIAGVGLSSTGVGALAGVPVIIVSGEVVATGTATAAHGISVVCSSIENLRRDLKEFTENRPPLDRETVLSDGTYKATNKKVKNAKVYEKDGRYYHRDTFHEGKGSHLEVYDKRGNHLGEADIRTGEIKPGTADATKKLYL